MIAEALIGFLRLAHALAAALWVGGALILVVAPSLVKRPGQEPLGWRQLREALRLAIGVFVLTGAAMAAERLAGAPLPPTYFVVLALKVAVGSWMFVIARRLGLAARDSPPWRRPEWQVLGLGVVVYGLAVALKAIYEATLRG